MMKMTLCDLAYMLIRNGTDGINYGQGLRVYFLQPRVLITLIWDFHGLDNLLQVRKDL